jgi:hypothetical protein
MTALLALLTRIDELTARAVPIVGTGLVVIGIYWLGVTHGALTIMQVRVLVCTRAHMCAGVWTTRRTYA